MPCGKESGPVVQRMAWVLAPEFCLGAWRRHRSGHRGRSLHRVAAVRLRWDGIASAGLAQWDGTGRERIAAEAVAGNSD